MKTRILVIEDHPDWQELLSFYLRRMGYQVLQAKNREEGKRRALDENPDLILLDLGLPDIEGVEIACVLKNDPKTCHIPIVVLTAWPEYLWKDRAFKAGVDEYLTKPILPALLKETVEGFKTIQDNASFNRAGDDCCQKIRP